MTPAMGKKMSRPSHFRGHGNSWVSTGGLAGGTTTPVRGWTHVVLASQELRKDFRNRIRRDFHRGLQPCGRCVEAMSLGENARNECLARHNGCSITLLLFVRTSPFHGLASHFGPQEWSQSCPGAQGALFRVLFPLCRSVLSVIFLAKELS